jgi:hypothetical protein
MLGTSTGAISSTFYSSIFSGSGAKGFPLAGTSPFLSALTIVPALYRQYFPLDYHSSLTSPLLHRLSKLMK